jgi:hypothetical protein
MEEYLRLGFSYTTNTKVKNGVMMKEIVILYHDLDIYYQMVNIRVECDILFKNICEGYKNDFIK